MTDRVQLHAQIARRSFGTAAQIPSPTALLPNQAAVGTGPRPVAQAASQVDLPRLRTAGRN